VPQADRHAVLSDAERISKTTVWNVNSSGQVNSGMPVFSFSGSWALSAPWALSFTSLGPFTSAEPALGVHSDMTTQVSGPLAFNPDSPPRQMELRIIVSECAHAQPLASYVSSIVRDTFDEIKVRNDLQELHAVSLRCYARSAFRNVPDEFCAFVAFDSPPLGPDFLSAGDRLSEESAGKVRYLIAMRTSRAVEDKAESILDQVLCRFSQAAVDASKRINL
jgi:hypothetical protein